MFIDEIVIHASAGRGGDGVVRFSGTMKTNGPTGGDGGRGGNIILLGVADLGALRSFRNKKHLVAGDGGVGKQNTKKGHNGKDFFIRVPVGTVAKNTIDGNVYEVLFPGQQIVVAKGGNGGLGNFHFRSSRVTTPKKATPGKQGASVVLQAELKLIADIGFIGYPNVGKSSLINELTQASSKVGNYRFTTLEPHLGVHYGTILADIPGLIEGASEGKGLGYKFLRHIERTRVLFHLVSAVSENPLDDYEKVRTELGRYNPMLLEKSEWILLSRADEKTPQEIRKIARALEKKNPHILVCSILDEESMKEVSALIARIAKEIATFYEEQKIKQEQKQKEELQKEEGSQEKKSDASIDEK